MKYLKLFEQQTESDIAQICEKYGIDNWSISSEGLVDVDGSVDLSFKKLTKLPLKFGRVSKDFFCSNNRLNSLHGCPQVVNGNFNCQNNKLTNLEGSPNSVGGDFCCYNNHLTSLEGCAQMVGANFWCQYNQLTNLEGSPQLVGGNFWCLRNKLTSLRFAPEEIEGRVIVLPNPISDIPKKYLDERYLEFIIKEQPDWKLYQKDGAIRLDRLEEMIEWGKENNKIKRL